MSQPLWNDKYSWSVENTCFRGNSPGANSLLAELLGWLLAASATWAGRKAVRMRRKGYHELPVSQESQKKGEKAPNGDPQNQDISLCFTFVLCYNLYFTMNMPVLHHSCLCHPINIWWPFQVASPSQRNRSYLCWHLTYLFISACSLESPTSFFPFTTETKLHWENISHMGAVTLGVTCEFVAEPDKLCRNV